MMTMRRGPGSPARPPFILGLVGRALAALAPAALVLLAPELVEAQAQGAAQPPDAARQMRHFWHVFAAYAVAWILVFGWAVSISRRLGRIEERLGR